MFRAESKTEAEKLKKQLKIALNAARNNNCKKLKSICDEPFQGNNNIIHVALGCFGIGKDIENLHSLISEITHLILYKKMLDGDFLNNLFSAQNDDGNTPFHIMLRNLNIENYYNINLDILMTSLIRAQENKLLTIDLSTTNNNEEKLSDLIFNLKGTRKDSIEQYIIDKIKILFDTQELKCEKELKKKRKREEEITKLPLKKDTYKIKQSSSDTDSLDTDTAKDTPPKTIKPIISTPASTYYDLSYIIN